MDLTFYSSLLNDLKTRIKTVQIKATLAANAELIAMYWDIGNLILQRQQTEGWSARVIPKLANDLKNELPELKGFSERSLGYMLRLAKEYPILQQPVAKLADEFELTRALPENLKPSLPSIEAIEKELSKK